MKQESQVQDQTYEKSEWVFPNSGWQKSIRNDLVFLTFPQDDAHFLLDSVITLGWQPVLEPSLPISYYEIVITRTNSDQNTVAKTGMVDENMVSTYLFTSLQAGRYFWTVRAVTENGKTIPGEGRYLNVIE
jgi:hypothetical protein